MKAKSHPTAIVHPKAKIGKDVTIGPYAVIDEEVSIGDGTVVMHGAHLTGRTRIGRENEIHMGAVIGHTPQDRTFGRAQGETVLGDRNVIREYVTIHRGKLMESSTTLGNDNFFMAYSHVAHDCQVGNQVTVCNATTLGGYVIVEDRVFMSGHCAVHQFVRIGKLAMIGACIMVTQDIPPFMLLAWGKSGISTLNHVGLRRAGLSEHIRSDLKKALVYLYHSGLNTTHALEEIEGHCDSEEAKYLVRFIRDSKRGILHGSKKFLTKAETEGILQ